MLALERDGLVVRGRAMRTSAFVLPAAIAPMVAAATAQPLERFAWMLREAGVDARGLRGRARRGRRGGGASPGRPASCGRRRGWTAIDVSRLVSYLALRGDLVVLGAASA